MALRVVPLQGDRANAGFHGLEALIGDLQGRHQPIPFAHDEVECITGFTQRLFSELAIGLRCQQRVCAELALATGFRQDLACRERLTIGRYPHLAAGLERADQLTLGCGSLQSGCRQLLRQSRPSILGRFNAGGLVCEEDLGTCAGDLRTVRDCRCLDRGGCQLGFGIISAASGIPAPPIKV